MGSRVKNFRLNMKALLVIHLVSLARAGNIVEELSKAGATTLISLVEKAGLVSTLEGDGPFTVFAPDNAAFAALPAELVNTLVADTELLKTVLLNHVVVGQVLSRDISNDIVVEAAGGAKLRANIYSKGKWYPPVVTINGKAVKKADILADNGVIHVLSEVLADTASGTIAEIASGDERFSTLVSLVVQAGLADTLASEGPFTVFAPTNEAFSKIPKNVVNSLLEDTKALKAVLLRHVVPGTLFSKGISYQKLKSAGGDNISTQTYHHGQVVKVSSKAGRGKVIQADVLATNGVIHAIDTVI